MAEKINDGGPAFPLFFPESKTREGKTLRARDEHPGMSLRDYFAGQCVIGLLSSESNPTMAAARMKVKERNGVSYGEQLAIEVYQLADAMLAEREKGSPT